MKIIFYILDSLRADHIGCYGYRRPTSPNLDRLAAEGTRFANAFAASTWTRPSAASILTGRYPLSHGVETFHSTLDPGIPTLAGLLQEQGFRCAAFSTIAQVSAAFGFDRGFDDFYQLFRGDEEVGLADNTQETGAVLPSSEDLNRALFPWIERHASENFFCLAWSIDPHVPYTIPAEQAVFVDEAGKRHMAEIDYKSPHHTPEELRWVKDLYDSCILYNDGQIGELVAFLQRLDIYDDCLLVIAGDHGELFNEHLDPRNALGEGLRRFKRFFKNGRSAGAPFSGRRGHIDVPPYDQAIHVPLIFKWPHGEYAGTRIDRLVSLIDLAPTAAARVLPPEGVAQHQFDGRDLRPWLEGRFEDDGEELVFCSEKSYPHCPAYYAVRGRDWKYLLCEPAGFSRDAFGKEGGSYLRRYLRQRYLLAREMLFDLRSLGELRNVAGEHPETVRRFATRLENWRRHCQSKRVQRADAAEASTLDDVNERQLRALGYTT